MKTAICGIGNKLRGDDGIGPLVIEELGKTNPGKNTLLLDCGSAPENFLGKIEKFRPDRVIVIDTVNSGKKPGSVELINTDNIWGQLTSTHKLPVSLFINYLQKSLKSEVIFIGVQPKTVGFNREMSREGKISIGKAREMVLNLIMR